MKTSTFALLLCSALPAIAAPLTLGEALARVEAGHPFFRTREATAALGAARTTAASALPPAELSLQVENVLGTGELRGAHGAETTLQFSRALDWVERRRARVAVAGALGEADRALWEEQRRALLAEAARRFIRTVTAETELANAREAAALARATVEAVLDRVARGVAAAPELARAQLALTEAGLDAEHAEHQLLSARQALAGLWGADNPDFDDTEADLGALPVVEPYATLAARLADTPAQARFAAFARWRLAQAGLARTSGARGEPRWNAGLRRTEATDDFGFVVGLSYAWPARQLAGAHAAEAGAERDRTLAEGESALLEARTALFELCQELNHARIEHDAARDEMLPAAQRWLAAVETGAAAGRYGVRDLLEARAALFAARRRQTEAAAGYHTTLVAIEQLLGGPAHP